MDSNIKSVDRNFVTFRSFYRWSRLALLLGFLPVTAAALEVQDVRAIRLQDRTEVRFSFDQAVPVDLVSRAANDPRRQIIDFPVALDNLGPLLHDGSESGTPSVRVVHRLENSSLELSVKEKRPAYLSAAGRTLIVRLGGAPFVQLTGDSLVRPQDSMEMEAEQELESKPQTHLHRVGGSEAPGLTALEPVVPAPAPSSLMLSSTVQSLGEGEQLVMLFSEMPDVRQATLDGEVLEIFVPNIEGVKDQVLSEGALFSGLLAQPEKGGVMIKLRLEESAHQVYLADKRIVVEFQPLQSNREIAELEKSGGLPLVTSATVEEGDDSTELKVSFDRPLTEQIKAFDLPNPARFVVDLKADLEGLSELINLDSNGRLSHLEFAVEEGQSRLVLSLKDNYSTSASQSESDLFIRINGPKPYVASSQRASRPASDSEGANELLLQEGLPVVERPELLSVQSKLENSGTEVIELEFDSKTVEIKSRRIGDRLRVQIQDAKLEAELGEELPLEPGRYFEQAHVQAGTRSVNLNLLLVNSNYTIRKNGKRVELVLTPDADVYAGGTYLPNGRGGGLGRDKGEDEDAIQPRYAGAPISLNVKDADIRSVMQVFAEFADMNLVLSDSVRGSVTVHLKDVPWDQALDIVMQTNGLSARNSGKVLIVSTMEEALTRGAQAAESDVTDELEPLVARNFQISYQTTAELVNMLRDEKNNLMSRRGRVIADERTSQLFIEDTPQRVAKIASLVRQLDRPVEQVMIEAKIVLADTAVSKDLSLALQTARTSSNIAEGALQFGETTLFDGRPGSQVTGAYTLLNSAGTRFVNLQLQAFESDDRARTVSNPRLVTSNKEQAVIEQGTEIPYRSATSSGATEVEFRSATLKLQVTPQVAPDGSIMLDVEVSKDSVGQETSGGVSINTRSVATKVSVMNGGTVVLGGIFEKASQESKSQVPVLGDIPVLGHLFRTTGKGSTETELLIFITPVILSGT